MVWEWKIDLSHFPGFLETAISEASRRFSLKMGNDEKVLNLVRMIEVMLKI